LKLLNLGGIRLAPLPEGANSDIYTSSKYLEKESKSLCFTVSLLFLTNKEGTSSNISALNLPPPVSFISSFRYLDSFLVSSIVDLFKPFLLFHLLPS
jgi:hypothetical protein